MDRSQPTDDQVLSAVMASGFLLEHSAATIFENAGFHVETAWPFEDPESKKSREIDIRAIKGVHSSSDEDIQVFVELLIECKASKSPFVFLERFKNKRELNNLRFEQYVFKKKRYEKQLQPGRHSILWPSEFYELNDHYYLSEEKKANHFTKVVRKGNEWVANHDGIYDSLILPMAKATDHRIKHYRKEIGQYRPNIAFLTFPCVVLDRSLLVIDTSDDNAVSEKDRVSFVRNFDSEVFQGELLLDFVSTIGLVAYIPAVEAFGQHVLAKLQSAK